MRNFAVYGIAEAAHDISDGGLLTALAEMVYDSGIGMKIELSQELAAGAMLFSESASRAIVVVPENGITAFNQLCEQLEQPVTLIGEISAEGAGLEITGLLELSYQELTAAFQTPLLPL